MSITLEQVRVQAPAVFTTQASPKLTQKYNLAPTIEIIEGFQREGWEISSAKQMGNNPYGIHEVRLRNGGLPQVGDSLVEAIIRNSHNGLSSLSIGAGLHRLVCSNGLTVPTAVASSIRVRHMKVDMGDIRRLTDEFAENLPVIGNSMGKMDSTIMSDSQVNDFGTKAKIIRWVPGSVPSSLSIEELVRPVRPEDAKQSVWNVFNRVQEKFVRGGISYHTPKGRFTTMRELKNISSLQKVNTQLWELAETYC
jgi:hypothetical protein